MVVVLLRFPFGARNLVGHRGGFNGNRLARKGKARRRAGHPGGGKPPVAEGMSVPGFNSGRSRPIWAE